MGEACTRWLAGQGETFDLCRLSLAQTVDVQQLIQCQIVRSIHYTSTIIVRLPEEATSQVQSLLVLVLLL